MIHELEITMSCITMFVVMGEVTVAISEWYCNTLPPPSTETLQ